jgi:hypothetical protein
VSVPVVLVTLDGNERVMDRMDRALETVDPDHEGCGQQRDDARSSRSKQA